MAWVGVIVIVTLLAVVASLAVLAAIAAAIEVLPSRRPGSGSEPIDDERSTATGATARIHQES